MQARAHEVYSLKVGYVNSCQFNAIMVHPDLVIL